MPPGLLSLSRVRGAQGLGVGWGRVCVSIFPALAPSFRGKMCLGTGAAFGLMRGLCKAGSAHLPCGIRSDRFGKETVPFGLEQPHRLRELQ